MTGSFFHLKAIIPTLCVQQPIHSVLSGPGKLKKALATWGAICTIYSFGWGDKCGVWTRYRL